MRPPTLLQSIIDLLRQFPPKVTLDQCLEPHHLFIKARLTHIVGITLMLQQEMIWQRAASFVMLSPKHTATPAVITNTNASPHKLKYLSLLDRVKNNRVPQNIETELRGFDERIMKQEKQIKQTVTHYKRISI